MRFIALGILLLTSLLGSCSKTQSKQTIHVIGSRDEMGKSRSLDLLIDELSALGHHVEYCHFHDLTDQGKADVNLFVEDFNPDLLATATKNYFIPNPDTCRLSANELKQFDKILCKTRESAAIFSKYHTHSEFLGFSCKDQFDTTCMKNYMLAVHIAGQSTLKGTERVANVWTKNPQFPGLLLLRHQKHPTPPADNVTQLTRYVPDDELKLFQNGCGIHLCPSETTEIPLTLLEAMSCGNIVVTINAPPFNSLVQDPRCLTNYRNVAEEGYTKRYVADEESLDLVVSNLFSLPIEELQEMGQKNRELYLDNHQKFVVRLAELI